MRILVKRIILAASLEARLYERVRADPKTLDQAAAVVALSGLAAGVGAMGRGGLGGLFVGTFVALSGWCLWATLTYLTATKLLPGPRRITDIWEWARPLGFSAAPGLIRVVGIVPLFSEMVVLVASMWMLVAMVVAVQAVDFSATGRAVAVSVIGWLVYLVIEFLWYAAAGVA